MFGGRGWSASVRFPSVSTKQSALLAAFLTLTGLGVVVVVSPASAAEPKPAVRSCADEQPTAEAARRMAAVCARRVEILSERTEYSQTFLNVDGSRTLEEGIEPVRVRKGSSWVPVDTLLKVTSEGVIPKATVLPVVFSRGGDEPLARVRNGDHELGMTWPERLPQPVLQGDTAIYRDVLPDVDLQVTAAPLGFSEVLVVRSPAGAANPKLASVRFGLATKGVMVSAAEGGGLSARDKQGRTVFEAPAPLMWDSSPVASAPAPQVVLPGEDVGKAPAKSGIEAKPAPGVRAQASRTGPVGGTREGARQAVMPVRVAAGELTVVPDQKILTDPGVQFPIYIDPSWTGNISGGAWTTVWSKLSTSSFWKNASALTNGSTYGSAGAGRTEDCSGCSDYIIRSFFAMDTGAVRGKHIQAATFRIEQRHAWTCSPKSNAKLWLTGAISSGTTWSKQPTWDSSYTAQTAANRKVGAVHGCAGPGTIEFNVTSMVTRAAAANWTTLTVGLRAVDEGTLSQWKRFNHASPKLAITYNTKPNAPADRLSDGRACATGAARPYVLTTAPILAAKQSDPDTSQQSLTTSFYWWPLGGARNETDKVSQSSGNISSVSKAIPAGRLSDGGTYAWQSQTSDGVDAGPLSGTCEFTVDATPPPTPGNVASAEYPAGGAPHGGVGVAGAFNVNAPSLRPYEVKEYAWTLDSAVLTAAATVPARTTDYGASISLLPQHDGSNTLRVWAKDQAGRFSDNPATYTFTVRSSGPAARWTFDEANGAAVDVTNHGNTASLSAVGAIRVVGRAGVGTALSVNGSTGYAVTAGPAQYPNPDTGTPTAMRTDASFTVTAWAKLASTGGTVPRAIVTADGSRTSAYRLGYNEADNKWTFTMANADTDTPAEATVLSNSVATAGKWTHLAGVFDGTTHQLRLYVNGMLQTATATLSGGFNATGPVNIGQRKWNGVLGDRFSGEIDDVWVYNFAETQAKLAELAVPLPPVITFPNGADATAGGQLAVRFDAGGDTNVTKFRYSVGGTALDMEVVASGPGGTATVTINVGGETGERPVHAVAVDGGNRVSDIAHKEFVVAPAVSLFGVVIDITTFLPVIGATVRLEPAGLQVVTGVDGGYTFTGFAPGTYTVTATFGGRCGLLGSNQVEVDGQGVWSDLYLFPYSDELGYTCDEQTSAFAPANGSVVSLSGDDAVVEVGLPFVFPFYGQAYRSAWVDTNGVLSFTDPGGSHPYTGGGLPAPAEPNAVVAPFWDDLVVDASASVRTASIGTGVDQRFVVEWRNVYRKASASQRVSFEVILAANGTMTTNYDSLDGAAEQGASAAVGIEAPAGESGLLYSAGAAVLASGRAIVFDHPEAASPLELHDLSGTLTNAAGTPVVGVKVTLDPSGLSTTTGTGGAWRFDDLVADSYTVSATVGTRCPSTARAQVELNADTVRNLQLGPDYGGLGYACTTGSAGYVAASTVFALTGDEATASMAFPFPVRMHGQSYSSGSVNTNGLVIFGPTVGTNLWNNVSLPSASDPNAVVAPFWDDLVIDAQASIRTAVLGTAPNRSFVVEWRNALIYDFAPDRVTFEVMFHEDGRISFHYTSMTTPWQYGGAATVGIENASGTVGTQYLFREAALAPNLSLTYTPAPVGTISGTLTTAVTSTPVAGATVKLNPGGTTAVTGPDGSYQFTSVPVGEYTLTAATGDARCAGQYARQVINHPGGTSDVDLSLMTDGDEFGYKCDSGPQTFIPGTVAEGWSGDDTTWPKNPPFPIKLYGQSYTSAWINSNGLITFQDPSFTGWVSHTPSPIPSPPAEGVPNAAVYVLWDHWVVDSQALIATKTSGTAPNRQWVVEWRNVHQAGNTAVRATFEAIFDENGTITLAYANIDPANLTERGGTGTVGIENGSGSIAFQYSYQEALLASGQGIRFRPNPPGQGSVSGTVTCQGAPVAAASLATAGLSTTTAGNGTYRVSNVPAGTYAVIATIGSGACKGSTVKQVVVGTNTQVVVDFTVAATPAGAGYTIAEQPVTFTPAAGTVLPLTGDDAYKPVNLPFPVTLYGRTYTNGWVDTNGLITFVDSGEPSPDAWPIPSLDSPEEPNAAIYPFWHDWVVDTNASVRAETRGTAPNRQYVVEWRNVHSFEAPTTRVSFQVILDEAGGYTFAYTDIDGTYLELGGGATIGIENADGTLALQYTYRQPVLRPGLGLRINPPTS